MSGLVHVVCATPPTPNPGMGSVDLAFYGLWQRHFPDVDVRFCQLFTADEQHRHRSPRQQQEFAAREALPFAYHSCRNRLPALAAGRAVIFWGDFLHMAHYRQQLARRLVALGITPTLAEGIAAVDQHFFLADSPDGMLNQTLAFGGTLIFNCAADRLDPAYENLLRRWARQTRGIWMRDLFSARLINRLRNDWSQSFLGVDCALLLEDASLAGLPRQWAADPRAGTDRGVAGLFLSRNVVPQRLMLAFARAVCRARGVRAEWLPWRSSRFPEWPSRWAFPELARPVSTAPPALVDLLDRIRRYDFVISDTYHVCVNAWRLGIPAICIGETWSRREMDVSCGVVGAWRDKRWVFYAMNEALEFYIHAGELTRRRWRERRAAETAERLASRPLLDLVRHGIQERAAAARQAFLDALFSLIR
ncbi:MAG TPA: polysaccharide pyruvyl transferase family protein [Verrucomicrobiota bacterium]|nr:polysaccharide pyruvyl transferase family protein [Verrucomicrobiota bacterium]HPV92682.1 polysaccharide pyruvyl transferase family protein [Verrucomicrobiota bacterium]